MGLLAVEKLQAEKDKREDFLGSLILACANFQLGDFAASFNAAIFVCVCIN